MKSLTLALTAFLFTLSCQSQSFRLLSATSQKYHAGVKGAGGGVNYTLHVIANQSSSKLKFDSLYVKGRRLPVGVSSGSANPKPGKVDFTFAAGDTLRIKASLFERGERHYPHEEKKVNADPDTTRFEPPIPLKGDALLKYRYGKKRKYLQVEKFEVLQPLAYP